MTNTAKSASAPPLFLRLVNAACPGVSISRNPGMFTFMPDFSINGQADFNLSMG